MIHPCLEALGHEGKTTVPKDFNFVPRPPTGNKVMRARVACVSWHSIFLFGLIRTRQRRTDSRFGLLSMVDFNQFREGLGYKDHLVFRGLSSVPRRARHAGRVVSSVRPCKYFSMLVKPMLSRSRFPSNGSMGGLFLHLHLEVVKDVSD